MNHNQALVNVLIEQRNVAQNTAADAAAELIVEKVQAEALRAKVAELETALKAVAPAEPVVEAAKA